MAKKHKNHKKEKFFKWDDNTKWVVVLAIVAVFIIFNTLGTRSLILDAWNKLRPTQTLTPTPSINISPAAGLSADQANYVKLALEALSTKLKIKKEDIKVVSVKETQWNDSSLGCPEKDKLYLQVITPGFLIELEAKGIKYNYHGGSNRVVSC